MDGFRFVHAALSSAPMGIFGAIAGGTLGFVVGGPIGAILGLSLGSQLGDAGSRVGADYAQGQSFQQRGHQQSQQQGHAVFVAALSSLAAQVSKADGRVTQDEIAAFDHFLIEALGLSVSERRYAADIFNQAKSLGTPASEYATQLGQLFRPYPDRLRDVVTILLSIAQADGRIDEAEESLIRNIARDMGLSAADYKSCRATFNATRGVPDTSPYEVLGVSEQASDAEVKSAHRRLVREYHPDVLQAKAMPEEFMKFASEKLVAVNDAWARVKQERGL